MALHGPFQKEKKDSNHWYGLCGMRNELCINGQTNATYVQSPRQTEEKLSWLWMPKLLVILLIQPLDRLSIVYRSIDRYIVDVILESKNLILDI